MDQWSKRMKWFALLELLLFLGVAVAPIVVGQQDELPDLIVKNIVVDNSNDLELTYLLKNKGNETTTKGFNITIKIRQVYLINKPGIIWYNDTIFLDAIIAPKMLFIWNYDISMIPQRIIPSIYHFKLVINPDQKIIESTYSNNEYHKYYLNCYKILWFHLY